MQIVWIVLLSLVGLIVGYVLFLFIATRFANPNREYTKISPFFRALGASIGYVVLTLSNVRMVVEGKELLPEGRFLLVCNHRSNFDPFVTWIPLLQYDLAFISKPENFKIPILGRLLYPLCFLPLDRDNAKNAVQTINKASSLLKTDAASIAIYPEGTRNKTDATLLPFHNGAFKIAQKADVPIVVTVLTGTRQISKNAPFRRSTTTLKILRVLSAEEVKSMRSAEIGDLVEALMLKELA